MFIAAIFGPFGLWLAGSAMARLARLPDKIDRRSPAVFIVVFTLLPLSVFIVFSLFHGVKMNWTGPVWLALVPAMANVIARVVRNGSTPRLANALNAGTAISMLLSALFLHYLALGFPFIGYSGTLRGLPVAWEEFGSGAQQIKSNVEAETGYSPLLVGMDTYNIASELGFYTEDRAALDNITSQNLFGKNGLMFGVWASGSSSERRVVIMYGLKESNMSPDGLANWFDSIGPVRTQVVQKNDAVAGQFFYRIGYKLRQPN